VSKKKKRKGKNPPSHAALDKPPEELVKELRENEGKNNAEIFVIMKGRHYKPNEITRVLPIKFSDFGKLANGPLPTKEKPGAPPVKKEEDNNENGEQQETGTAVVTTSEEVTREVSSGSQFKDSDANYLYKILRFTAGAQEQNIRAFVELYEQDREYYDENPHMLAAALRQAGVGRDKAETAVIQFMHRIGKIDKLPVLYYHGGGNNGLMALAEGREKEDDEDEDREVRRMERQSDREAMRYEKMFNKMMWMKAMETWGDGSSSTKSTKNKSMVDEMKDMLMLKMLASVTNGMGGGGMGMGMMGSPFMAPEVEFAMSEEGKPVLDSLGNPIPFRIRQVPMPWIAQQWNPSGKKENDGGGENALAVKAFETMGNVMTSLTATKDEALTTLATNYQTQAQNQLKFYEDRLGALENSDPTDYLVNTMTKLKELGLIDANRTDNTEIKKMDIDLKKWSHEQNMNLQKWIWEQKQQKLDKDYARDQMKQFHATLRTGMDKIGVPLATSYAQGLREGSGQHRGGSSSTKQHAPASEQQDITQLPDEELIELNQEADRAYRMTEQAKRNIAGELKKRQIPV
jgi:hypothetical protein